MKTVGLIGGMTWHTTQLYYQKLNEGIQAVLGENHSVKCVLYSFDFEDVKRLQDQKKWQQLSKEIIYQGNQLRNAGADCLVLCSNTVHKMSGVIRDNVRIPLLHIVEAIGEEIVNKQVLKVLLLGTRYTMLDNFYQDELKRYGVEVVVPTLEWMNIIHQIIFQELAKGDVNEDSKLKLIGLIESYALGGTTGVVLGCTELGLMFKDPDVSVHVFDSLEIHVNKILKHIL